ncbi:MAG: hypothetical protein K2X47_16485 [Bdellovibrionales bacterium]|nr:hypothetical protein [Bdellovibrionales bacterium]
MNARNLIMTSVLSLVCSQVASAQTDMLARYAIVTGGFGQTLGGPSVPVSESRGDASEVSDALKVTPDSSGEKKVGITWGGSIRGLSCSTPKQGNCKVEVVLPINAFDLRSNSITIQGAVADMIRDAFAAVTPHNGPLGTRRSVANIVCYEQATRPGNIRQTLCRIRDFSFNGTAQTLRQIVQSGFLTEAVAMKILKDSQVR